MNKDQDAREQCGNQSSVELAYINICRGLIPGDEQQASAIRRPRAGELGERWKSPCGFQENDDPDYDILIEQQTVWGLSNTIHMV